MPQPSPVIEDQCSSPPSHAHAQQTPQGQQHQAPQYPRPHVAYIPPVSHSYSNQPQKLLQLHEQLRRLETDLIREKVERLATEVRMLQQQPSIAPHFRTHSYPSPFMQPHPSVWGYLGPSGLTPSTPFMQPHPPVWGYLEPPGLNLDTPQHPIWPTQWAQMPVHGMPTAAPQTNIHQSVWSGHRYSSTKQDEPYRRPARRSRPPHPHGAQHYEHRVQQAEDIPDVNRNASVPSAPLPVAGQDHSPTPPPMTTYIQSEVAEGTGTPVSVLTASMGWSATTPDLSLTKTNTEANLSAIAKATAN